jgi:hypothetical protein
VEYKFRAKFQQTINGGTIVSDGKIITVGFTRHYKSIATVDSLAYQALELKCNVKTSEYRLLSVTEVS